MITLLATLADPHKTRFLAGFRMPLLAGLIALAACWFLTPYVRRLAISQGAIDGPKRDERRVHKAPIPRWGGLAIFGGLLVALAVCLPLAQMRPPVPAWLIGMLVGGGLLVVLGALDDLYDFPARLQLVYLLAIGVAIQYVFDPAGRVQIAGTMTSMPWLTSLWHDFGWLSVPITAIYIFVVTKTMDTIDGLDGLAAGIAAIAGATLSIIASIGGQPRVALVAAAVAGSCIGFLRFNYNPARIFMGTGGAQLLGFVLACISIVGAMKTAAAVALFIPLLVFGVQFFDAVQVVIRRVVGRQPILQADKRHLHHALLEKGLTQRQAVWILYLVAMALCGVLLYIVKLHG